MSALSTLIRAYLKFYFTTKRFIVIILLYAAISFIFPAISLAAGVPKPGDVFAFTSSDLSSVASATALAGALLAGDALTQDFSRQGLFTLTQPLGRSLIMITRLVAAFVATAIAMLVGYLGITIGFSLYLYGTVVPSIGAIIGVSLLFIAAMVAFVILFSSMFKSPLIAIVLAIVIIWLVMPGISAGLEFTTIEPWFLISYSGQIIPNLAAKTLPPHVTSSPLPGFVTLTSYNPFVWEALAIMFGYLVLSLLLGWFIYSRRELKEV